MLAVNASLYVSTTASSVPRAAWLPATKPGQLSGHLVVLPSGEHKLEVVSEPASGARSVQISLPRKLCAPGSAMRVSRHRVAIRVCRVSTAAVKRDALPFCSRPCKALGQ